jgi:hypothetical protein
MYNTDIPTRAELPSTTKLVRSTVLAAVIAGALLVTVVLPSEYAIDPTGVGGMLGLTQMGDIKNQLAQEAELDRANATAADQSAQASQPAVTQTVSDTPVAPEPAVEQAAAPAPSTEDQQANIQPEASSALVEASPAASPAATSEETSTLTWRDDVSFTLAPGEGTEYKLTMEEGAIATFAWSSEGGPVNFDTHGDGGGNSISYEKGRGMPEDEGELEAAFTGNHGWFFRNRNDEEVTVTLRINGDYGELKRML